VYTVNKSGGAYFNWDYNYITDTVVVLENINISEIVSDEVLTYGYLERYPVDILNNNLLFKNSFKGYITESSFYRDQVYLRKFNNTIPVNSFQYITDYTASYNDDLNQYNLIRPDFNNIIENPNTTTPFSSQNNTKSIITNDNKVPLKSYFNILENSNYLTEYNVTCKNLSSEDDYAMPRVEYFTNFTIDDIILIDESIIDVDAVDAVSNKITHIEYSRTIDSSSVIEYTGNDIIINNETMCIFTFDIMKNLISSDGYNVHDQTKFLMASNFTLEEYDENRTYQSYIDSTISYIQPIDLNVNSLKKENILNSLNQYIIAIKDSGNDLFVTKFTIQCFRDARYMFVYKISNKTILTDRKNYYNYQLEGRSIQSSTLFNPVFDNIISPYHVNFDNRMATSTYFKDHYFTRKPERWKGFTGNHYVYNGFYYSTEE
jgi:hypothetical protein